MFWKFKKCKKLLCMLLAIVVLCSGMYLEKEKNTFPIAQTQGQQQVQKNAPVSSIYPNETRLISGEACTTEMLGTQDSFHSGQITERQSVNEKESRLAVEFLWKPYYQQPLMAYEQKTVSTHYFKSGSSISLVMYIHNSDGKKRI